MAELDTKLRRVYEDNLSGKLPDHILTIFISDYDSEKAKLQKAVSGLETALERVRDTQADIGRFRELIQKYTHFETLDRFMLHELTASLSNLRIIRPISSYS